MVPIIGNIPLIGNLFKRIEEKTERVELVPLAEVRFANVEAVFHSPSTFYAYLRELDPESA